MFATFLSHEDILALGIFCSGIGSMITAIVSVVLAHRRAKDECQKRIDDIKEAFNRGYGLGRKRWR